MEQRAEFIVDREFLDQGIMSVERPLRALLKGHARLHEILFHLEDGRRVPACFYANLGCVHARELADWCRRRRVEFGARLLVRPVEDQPGVFALAVRSAAEVLREERELEAEARKASPPPVEVDRSRYGEVLRELASAPADVPAWLLGGEARDCLRRRGMDHLVSVNHVQGVDWYAHQVETVRRTVQDLHGRALLADEVGLGKTIEAGLVLKEYLLRGLVKRFIVFTPASLVIQWQEELLSKFGIEARTHAEVKDWAGPVGVVASLDTAKASRNREAILRAGFDLVIVDEAHKLKNQHTLNFKFVHSLMPRYLLLLTATPVHNSIEEIYNLVFLVKPGLLGTRRGFRAMFVSKRDGRIPRNADQLQKLLHGAMIRHRRDETDLTWVSRTVELCPVPFSPPEEALYASLYDFVRNYYGALGYFEEGLNRLTLMLLERLVTSSPQALRATLKRVTENPALPAHHKKKLLEVAALAAGVTGCAKLDRVVDHVRAAGDKVVIYTQFRESQQAICERLEAAGIKTAQFHGALTAAAREVAIKRFRGPVQVLVSTDAGGEGKNLQFCRYLVNYDLPWNPMKVEQRIGRIHRLGQTRDVTILNLYYRDSIEEYVVKLLADKIRLFTLVVGEVDAILGLATIQGEFERAIMDTYLKAADRGDRERAFEALGDKLSTALERYESIKDAQNRYFRF